MRSYNHTTADSLDEAVASHNVQSNPDYKTRIAQGIPLEHLPYSLDVYQSVATTQTTYCQYYSYGQELNVQDLGPSSTYVRDNFTGYQTVKADLEDQMQAFLDHKTNRLLSKIKAQSLPLLMMYKERRETGELIFGFLQKVADFAAKAKKRDWKGALRVYGIGKSSRPARLYMSRMKKWENRTNTVGAAWLQARFAWLPLYRDIADSFKSAAEYEKKIHTFRAAVGDSFRRTTEYYEDNSDMAWSGARRGFFGMVVHYAISDETLAAVGSMMDVPTTLWDAVPYSFVIDRIADVSSYLDLQNATLGTEFSSGSSTLYYVDTIKMPEAGNISYYPNSLTYTVDSSGRRYYTEGPSPTRTDVRMRRSPLSSFPVPKLEYPLRNSFVQGTDLFFLAAQVKKKLAARF